MAHEKLIGDKVLPIYLFLFFAHAEVDSKIVY